MYPVTSVLDTGAGPNLISHKFVRPECYIDINAVKDLGLTADTRQAVIVRGES